MSKISLERNCLRISLTPDEARNYGFHSNQSGSVTLIRLDDGSLEWDISSEQLRPGFTSGGVCVWIPPLPISRASAVSSAPSTTKPAVDATLSTQDDLPPIYSDSSIPGFHRIAKNRDGI